jgi:hypothetical protein
MLKGNVRLLVHIQMSAQFFERYKLRSVVLHSAFQYYRSDD